MPRGRIRRSKKSGTPRVSDDSEPKAVDEAWIYIMRAQRYIMLFQKSMDPLIALVLL